MGGGNLTTYIDPDVNPRLLPVPLPGLPDRQQGRRRPRPGARSRSRRPTATSTRSRPRSGWPRTRPATPPSFKHDFNTRYYDGPEVYKKMRDLAAEFPNISQVYDLPEKTTGYQRKAQTMLGYQAASVRDVRRQQPAGRQHGGARRPPTPTARSSSPRRPGATRAATASPPSSWTRRSTNSPLPVSRDRQRDHGQPGHRRHRRDHEHRDRRSSTRSTPTRPRPRS